MKPIEQILVEALSESLDVKVFAVEPDEQVNEYVVVEKLTGGEREHLKSSLFAFKSYSTSMYDSAILNMKTKEAVKKLLRLDNFAKVNLNNDYYFPDLTKKKPRYQAVFEINYYGG